MGWRARSQVPLLFLLRLYFFWGWSGRTCLLRAGDVSVPSCPHAVTQTPRQLPAGAIPAGRWGAPAFSCVLGKMPVDLGV